MMSLFMLGCTELMRIGSHRNFKQSKIKVAFAKMRQRASCQQVLVDGGPEDAGSDPWRTNNDGMWESG